MLPLDYRQHVDPEAIARELAPWLDDLEARIDAEDEERLWSDWLAFADGRWPEDVFRPRRRRAAPPGLAWPDVGTADAVEDPCRMVLHQLAGVSAALARGAGELLCVRANYGSGILPSLFGVPILRMPRAMDTLPGTRPLGAAAMPALADADPPGLDGGVWPLVRAVGGALQVCLRERPGLRRHVHIYHPDLQGPMDCLEMTWGSDCFTAMLEDGELVQRVLARMTDAYLAAMRDWDALVPDAHPGYGVHWGMVHRGHVMLRDDSAMNLSPRMFRTYIAPHDRRILDACGGGAIHACGRTDHFLPLAAALPGVHAINLGQPRMNSPDRVAEALACGVALIGLGAADWEAMRRPGLGRVHIAA